jgi:transposase
MDRGDLSDAEWELIGPLLPPERGRHARPAGDNRRYLNGMLHVLRVSCPWRDMHERYGKWNSVYVRFRRWAEQGVWDAMLQTLVDHAAALRARSTPAATIKASLSAST